MVLDMDQAQRRDIDEIGDNRITLVIDDENVTNSPYTFTPNKYRGNNWLMNGGIYSKLNIADDDTLTLVCSALTNLSQKDITKVIVSFDYNVSNVSVRSPFLKTISFSSMGLVSHKLVESVLNGQGHIDVDCQIFDISSEVLNTAICEQGFDIGLNFDGVSSNATVIISDVVLSFEFTNKLSDEIKAVANRLSGAVDFYNDEEYLILDFFGDGHSGSSGGSSGGSIDVEEVNRLINNAINRLGINLSMDTMSNGYLKIEAEINKGDE